MKKLSMLFGTITTIGLAIKNMGHLSLENAIAYGIVLRLSLNFIENLWNFIDKKLEK